MPMEQGRAWFEEPEARSFSEVGTLAWSTSIGFAGWSVFLEAIAFFQSHYRFPTHPTGARLILGGLWLPLVILFLIAAFRAVRARVRK
jgi:hypothetical protein